MLASLMNVSALIVLISYTHLLNSIKKDTNDFIRMEDDNKVETEVTLNQIVE